MVFEQAKWLQFNKDYETVFVRHHFSLSSKKKVVLRIIGLGFFKLWVNGKSVTKNLYNQLFTTYNRRDLSKGLFPTDADMKTRIYYNEYDITSYVNCGENLLAVSLGNGWYRNSDRYCEGDFSFSNSLRLVFEIEESGTICGASDEKTLCAKTHVIKSTLYNGEVQDFAKEIKGWNKKLFNDMGWEKPEIISPIESPLYKCECPSDKIVKTYSPKCVLRTPEYAIYDCGRNLTGYLKFTCAKRQESIKVEYAEEWDGKDILSVYRDLDDFYQSQVGEYKNVNVGQICEPQFLWYGFRFAKVYGKIKKPQICVVNTGLKRKTKFRCSNDILNWYHEASLFSIENNIHMGIQMDCPHRERYGYTGDGQVACDAVLFNFDAQTFYEKWIGDIADSQDARNGKVQNTAPYMGGSGGVGWGIAIVIIPWTLYKKYGDTTILTRYYSNMLAYLKYLQDFMKDGLILGDEDSRPKWLGDWSYPSKNKMLPVEFVSSYFFIKGNQIFKEVCKIVGVDYSSDMDSALTVCKERFIKEYFDESTGDFLQCDCAANAFALDIGFGDERTLTNLCLKYQESNCFDTGIFGTKLLLEILAKYGKHEIVYNLLASNQYPSFGWWKEQGATSLWEDWSGGFFTEETKVASSQNHMMFVAGQKYLFESVLGVKQENGTFIVSPNQISGVKYVYGKICEHVDDYVEVRLKRNGKNVLLFVKKGRRSKVNVSMKGLEKTLTKRCTKLCLRVDDVGGLYVTKKEAEE